MTFAIATFAIALGVVFGAYWLLVLRPEKRGALHGGRPVARLQDRHQTREHRAGARAAQPIPFLDRLLHRSRICRGRSIGCSRKPD